MSDNVKPTFPKAEVKSGLENEQYATRILDGIPTKKSVDEIEKVNLPGNAPGSVMKKN